MKRSIILPGLVTVFVALSPAAVAVADNPHSTPNNPNPTGQPNQNAELEPSQPAGFNTPGFRHATTVYAAGVDQGKNPKAVSQYDVAAFQVSQPHP